MSETPPRPQKRKARDHETDLTPPKTSPKSARTNRHLQDLTANLQAFVLAVAELHRLQAQAGLRPGLLPDSDSETQELGSRSP